LNVFSHETDQGWAHPPPASEMRGIALKKGQRVRLETPGGGGYGPAASRDPAAVVQDVAQGLITPEAARESCGAAWEVTP
jgi:N-methylhydantoinase B